MTIVDFLGVCQFRFD